MTMPLDRDVNQPRPNPLSPYQCGFSDIGVRCVPGPTADGQCCQAGRESQEAKLKCQNACHGCPNESKCSIAKEKSCSDQNVEQYQTCIPVKSHWYSRNILALNLAILAGGILLVCMALPSRERFFVPGTLSKSHSQILENTLISDRCSLCHPSAHGNTAATGTQDQLCMKCHTSHMPDAIKGSPHDLTTDQFARLVSLRSDKVAERAHPIEPNSTKCAQCHTEHHGAGFDVKAITDARCQSCHAEQFKSFSTSHPEFSNFPKQVARRIAFDHRAHLEKYYGQKNASFDCKSCHELDPENQSNIRRTASFQEACAKCHQEPLRASISDGWAVLQLPSLNDADLKAVGQELNNWPAGALYGYDGKITLPMRLLLSSDPNVAQALTQFPDGDLGKIRPRDAKQQAAARDIARGLRQLFRETALSGQDAWKTRLTSVATQALGRQPKVIEQQIIKNMVAGLPPDLFGQVESLWFNGRTGVAQVEPSRISVRMVSNLQEPLLIDSKDDQDEDPDSLLRGSSTQGLIFKNQVGDNTKTGTPPSNPVGAAQPTRPAQGPATQPSPNNPVPPKPIKPQVDPSKQRTWTLGAEDEPEMSADDLLRLPSSNPIPKQSNSGGSKDTRALSSEAVGNAQNGLAPTDTGGNVAGQSNSAKSKFASTSVVAEGGWYLDSQLYVVKYMPSGHADPVLAAWIQFAALLDSGRTKSLNSGDEAQAETPASWHVPNWKPGIEAVGGCTECHLLPSNISYESTLEIWQARRPSTAKQFTKFNHKPHTTLAVTSDCKHCHQFDVSHSQSYSEVSKSLCTVLTRFVHQQSAQQHFQCEFKTIEKSQCNACHRSGGANQGCTQCHNYHVGTEGFEASLSR
ncbi:MAG: hypothetical protein U0930_25165 [Pirellulales bacterium]